MTALSKLLALGLCLLLGGCTVSSELTKLELTLQADERLNPDLHDRPSPIVVRLLELRNPVAFENSDFFAVYQRPREVLNPDLAAQEELELRPGETRELRLSVASDSGYVGVVAAYRDLPENAWRLVIPLRAKAHNPVKVLLGERGIELPDDDPPAEREE